MEDNEASTVREVAKAVGKALDIVRALGAPLEPFGGIVRDWGNELRYKNLCRIADRMNERIAQRKLAGKTIPIPNGFVLPLLDAASLECEDEVLDLWAALIVNASDPEKRFVLKKVYIDILRGLQSGDVLVLKALTSAPIPAPQEMSPQDYCNAENLAQLTGLPLDDVQVSLQTLGRFACIIDTRSQTFESLDQAYSGIRVNDPSSNFRLSDLGRRLRAATE